MMKSIEFLNTEFTKIKVGKEFDIGSITPTTTSKKFILDEVKISEESKNLYKEASIIDARKELINKELNTKAQEKNSIAFLQGVNKEKYSKLDTIEISKDIDKIQSNLKNILNYEAKELMILEGFTFVTIYQDGIKEKVETNIPTVLRYGLDTESKALESIVGNIVEKGALHPYEEAVFRQAFKFLELTESAENYINKGDKKYYPSNVILVDIFDRSSGFLNKGHNQTHTIALWKKKDNEIVLIDPSQKSYSDHLLKPIKSIFDINISASECKMLYGVASYKPNDKTGYSDYSELKPTPRDCVDIAVKVGFELNEQQKSCGELKEVENRMLEQISNNSSFATHLIKLSGIVVRELHSSNSKNRNESKEIVKIVNNGLTEKIIPKININKIQNYQNIKELETIFTTITQKFV